MDETDAPMFGIEQPSPDELIAAKMTVRESAIQKLIDLGLTEEEVMSLISLDIAQ